MSPQSQVGAEAGEVWLMMPEAPFGEKRERQKGLKLYGLTT